MNYFLILSLISFLSTTSYASNPAAASAKTALNEKSDDGVATKASSESLKPTLRRPAAQPPVTNKLRAAASAVRVSVSSKTKKKATTSDEPALFTSGQMSGMQANISKEEAETHKTEQTVHVNELLGKIAITAIVATAGKPELNTMARGRLGYQIRLNKGYKRGDFVIAHTDKKYFYGLVTGKKENKYYVQVDGKHQQLFDLPAIAIREKK